MVLPLRAIIFLTLLTFCCCAYGASSFFHGSITDLSPPYFCKLKLTAAKGVGIENQRTYQFRGICSIKIPIGNTWIYQNVWVDLLANWNNETKEGSEITTLYNNLGNVVIQLRCDDDPWLTKSQCALVGYQNNTQFTNLGGAYNARTGQYPFFETMTGQYPPLARNQAIFQEALILSVNTARQEVRAANAQFQAAFSNQQQIKKPMPHKRSKKHHFKKS